MSITYNTYWFEGKTLDEITIRDILSLETFSVFMFTDIHNQITELSKKMFKPPAPAEFKSIVEKMTIAQCEMAFRYRLTENPNIANKFLEKYPSIAEYSSIIGIYGWFLPYYVDYTKHKEQLSKLPPITPNIRPISKNGYPHAFALHYANQQLVICTRVIFSNVNPLADAREARTEKYSQISNELEGLYLELESEFKKKNIKSASKQAMYIWEKHGGGDIGIEFSTLEKKIRHLKKHNK